MKNKKYYELPYHLARRCVQEAMDEIRKQHEKGVFDDADPNHPKHNGGYNYATGKYVEIFGYDQDEFMAKQYK